jgi:nitrate reductase alpha subunit
LAGKGKVRVEGAEGVMYDENSPYHPGPGINVKKKVPYPTLTTRQQYYIDHDWFLKFDEALPAHRDPLRIEGYPLQFMMGHARHGIHSMWRDDSLMLALQRGEPDIYIGTEDAAARKIKDGDKVRVFNPIGEFLVQAHVSSGIQPGMVFMYHGWDPMMFDKRQNFGAVTATGGLLKPTIMVSGYGHLNYSAISWTPNSTQKDFTCEIEKYVEAEAPALEQAG